MMSIKKTIGFLVAASLAIPGFAQAQNLDLDEVGALLALPVITGDNRSGALTAITVTNAGADAFIHVNVISGDDGEYWKAQDFTCEVSALRRFCSPSSRTPTGRRPSTRTVA